jgi:hypothetical protein
MTEGELAGARPGPIPVDLPPRPRLLRRREDRPHRHAGQAHHDIFGRPVYTYSYREAVADDWLIDHEPPIRYETLLSKHGIHFDKGEHGQAIDLAPAKSNNPNLTTN